MKRRVELPAQARTGDVVWESGVSEPVSADFQELLFEGIASRPGIVFEASLKDGQDWGAWVSAQGERMSRGRFWAKAVVTGKKGDLVRLRALFQGAGAPGGVEFFGLSAARTEAEGPSGGSPSPGPDGGTAPACGGAPRPDVKPRSAWGAQPATRPYEPMIPDRITVHHTEGDQPMDGDSAIEEMQSIPDLSGEKQEGSPSSVVELAC
jgi:hypothetical protein